MVRRVRWRDRPRRPVFLIGYGTSPVVVLALVVLLVLALAVVAAVLTGRWLAAGPPLVVGAVGTAWFVAYLRRPTRGHRHRDS